MAPGISPQKFKLRRLRSDFPNGPDQENLFGNGHDSPIKIHSLMDLENETHESLSSSPKRRPQTSLQLDDPNCTMPSIVEMVGQENDTDISPKINYHKGIRKIAGRLGASVDPLAPGATSVDRILQGGNARKFELGLTPFDQISTFNTPDY